jgi:HSP20 family protein
MKIIRYAQPVVNHCSPTRGNLDSVLDGFDSFFAWPQTAQTSWDTREDKDNYYLRLELPGLKREELKLSVVEQVLTIKGLKKNWKQENEKGADIERVITLPDQVNPDKIEAKYEDGVLYVTIPKREEVKPRTIEVSIN